MKKALIWIGAVMLIVVVLDYLVSLAMIRGVNDFYGLNRHSKVLLVGHSHLMLATDKERIERETGLTISKYTREGVNVSDREVMVRQYLNSEYSDSLRLCLYGVDLATFTGEGLSQNSYQLFYPFMDDPAVSDYIRSQTDAKDYWLHKLLRVTRFNDDAVKNGSIRGWRGDWSNRKNGHIDVEAYKRQLADHNERSIKMNPELMGQFDATIKMLTDRGVRVVLVNPPTIDLLNDYEPDKYQEMMDWFTAYAAANPMVEFWDLAPEYSSRHELFHDRLHLNADGQQEVTGTLIEQIRALNIKG